MKNEKYITYGKGVQNDDHVWFIPEGSVPEIDQLKVPGLNIKSISGAVGLGEVSDEGIAKTPGYGEGDAVYNQSGSPVVRSKGDYEPSVSFSLMQTAGDIEVDKVIYGVNNIEEKEGYYVIKENSDNKTTGVFIIDTELDNGGFERKIYPKATIQLSDDVNDTYTDVRLYPVTITPVVDQKGNASYVVKTAKIEG